jgi:transporter family-2 protein
MLLGLAMFAGANLTFQALVNAQLRGYLGSPLRAGLVSYIGGTLFCVAFLLIRRESLNVFDGRAPTGNAIIWTGGLYGLIYLVITVWLLPRIPATQVFAFIVAGQLLSALIFDQIGLFGAIGRSIDASKLLGVALLVVAVILIRR